MNEVKESAALNGKSLLTEAVFFSDNVSTLPPEIEAGNVEYKLKLLDPSPDRFRQLVTQMKWRLAEGQGEALYELGVSDHGILVGMTLDEYEKSLKTMKKMADLLGADMSVVRERNINGKARSISTGLRNQREDRKLISKVRNSTRRSSCSTDISQSSVSSSVSTCTLTAHSPPRHDDDIQHFSISDYNDEYTEETQQLKCAEVLVRLLNDNHHFIEIRIAFLGGTDAGKSTLLGYLSHGENDNGHGKARLNLLRHRHEIESGHSSALSYCIVGFSQTGQLLNYASTTQHVLSSSSEIILPLTPRPFHSVPGHAESMNFKSLIRSSSPNDSSMIDAFIVENAAKIAMLIDTCGMQKYIHTTLSSLTGYDPDYACLVIDGYAGAIDDTTRELLGCAFVLKVPVFVVVTKIDLCQASDEGKNKLKSSMESLVQLLMLPGTSRVPVVVQKEDDSVVSAQTLGNGTVVPIFLVSSVTGENMDLLTKFINLLPSRGANLNEISNANLPFPIQDVEFHIEETYSVPDVGTVIGGRLITGEILQNVHWTNIGRHGTQSDVSETIPLWLGPVDSLNGSFQLIHVTSAHRQRTPVTRVKPGQTASLALEGISKEKVRKGMVLLSNPDQAQASWEFEAEVMILFAPTDVKIRIYNEDDNGNVMTETERKNTSITRKRKISSSAAANYSEAEAKQYWGMVHVGNVRQPASILGIVSSKRSEEKCQRLVGGSRAKLRMRFIRSPEWVRPQMRLLYREGTTPSIRRQSEPSRLRPDRRFSGMKMVGEVITVFPNSIPDVMSK